MEGILILAHGSRAKATEKTFEKVVKRVTEKLPEKRIATAYMEFGSVNIEKGLKNLLDQGVNSIQVVPYFLFEGIHYSKDIPNEIEKFSAENKNIPVYLKKPLGDDIRLSEILADRILE